MKGQGTVEAVIWLRKLGRGERTVLIVALLVALGLAGECLAKRCLAKESLAAEYIVSALKSPVGWVAYAPLSREAEMSGFPAWSDYLILLDVTILWVARSLGFLRAGLGHRPTQLIHCQSMTSVPVPDQQLSQPAPSTLDSGELRPFWFHVSAATI